MNPKLDLENPNIAHLVYVKSNLGGWFFDAFIRQDHTRKLKMTEHPVQTGAAMVDHAYMEPVELTLTIKMSDAAESIVPGQFTNRWSRSVAAYDVLKEIQAQRIPCQVLTRLELYSNMMIQAISIPDDFRTLYGLEAVVTMREIPVAEVKTVKISSAMQTTGSTTKGTVEPVEVKNQSLLSQLAGWIKGGS